MAKFEVGDRVSVIDRPGWPDGYKLAGWTGGIIEVKDDPEGYVIMRADKTGYDMSFAENELDPIESGHKLSGG